jgi:hypothetical protein
VDGTSSLECPLLPFTEQMSKTGLRKNWKETG